MATVIDMLKKMSLKEFSIFQHALTKIRQDKVNKHFRDLFYKYITILVNKPEHYPGYKDYLECSDFGDETWFSKSLSFENNAHSFSMKKNEISFSTDDFLKSWKLKGTPDDYKVEFPHKFSWEDPKDDISFKKPILDADEPKKQETYEERQKRLEIPIPENMERYAVLFWRCYWMYLDSKPDDDRPLDEDEEEDQEELAESFGDSDERFAKWEKESEEREAEWKKEWAKERADAEASRKIKEEIREQKRKLDEQTASIVRTANRFPASFGADTPLQGNRDVYRPGEPLMIYGQNLDSIAARLEQATAQRINQIHSLQERAFELSLKNKVLEAEVKALREKHPEEQVDVDTRKNKMKEIDAEFVATTKEFQKQLVAVRTSDLNDEEKAKQSAALKQKFSQDRETFIAKYKELGITMHFKITMD